MIRRTTLLLALACCAIPAVAAPFVFYRGIVNAASFAPPELPNGAIARGSIFTIFGRDLGPEGGASATAFPLSTTLAGVFVEVCQGQGENCVAAIPLFVSPGQINAIMPSDVPLGDLSLRTRFDGETSNFSPVTIAPSSVGLFAVSSGGFGPGVVQNFVSQAEQPLNSSRLTAAPGQVVTLWGTGLGPALNPDRDPPQAGDLPVQVEIEVGGARVTNKLYSGRSPQFSGLDQIVFEIPADAPDGCFVPVRVRTAGATVSNTVTVAIQREPQPCADAANPFDALRPGGRTGVALLARFVLDLPFLEMAGVTHTTDFVAAAFQDQPASEWWSHRLFSLPPPGSCTSYSFNANVFRSPALPVLAFPGRPIDAGPSIRFAAGGEDLPIGAHPDRAGFYAAQADEGLNIEALAFLFDRAAPVRISGGDGAETGAFQVEVQPAGSPGWSNREQVRLLDRSSQARLSWQASGPGNGLTLGFVAAAAEGVSASTLVLCAAHTSQGGLTLDSADLGNLPPGEGAIGLVRLSESGAPFAAAGLDRALAVSSSIAVSPVEIR